MKAQFYCMHMTTGYRLGEERRNRSGDLMKIIKYNDYEHIVVEFQDEHKYQVENDYGNFKKGNIKNPYRPVLYGRGYIGVGKYDSYATRKQYDTWRKMFDRCYSHRHDDHYKGCEVCEEWWNFQNFAKWYDEHYWEDPKYPMQVDKDWKVIGNKIYSPNTCEIVPSIINSCTSRHDKTLTNDAPPNIEHTPSGKYRPRFSRYGKKVGLGTFARVSDAMKVYKDAKVAYIQELAEKYKEHISEQLYEQMMNYKQRFEHEVPEYAGI